MLAVGLAANVLEGALNRLNPTLILQLPEPGRPDVFWALAAFAGTFALGTILGRTMPAGCLALVVCSSRELRGMAGMTHFVLEAVRR